MNRAAQAVARLDRSEVLASADPCALGALLRRFPDQLAEAVRLGAEVALPRNPPRSVLLLGMGGSAIAGDMVEALAEPCAPFPVAVRRGYTVPGWVGPDTWVVASSYSGHTEETLAAFDAGLARGARGFVLSAGGALGERAERRGLPWIRLPAGFPPRAALAYLLGPLLVVLERIGGGGAAAEEIAEAVGVLHTVSAGLAPEVPLSANPAKELALWLLDRTPAIYGMGLTAPVAYRWRTQIEENAKAVALSGVLPEMNHNAIEAWGSGSGERWAVVLLRDHRAPARLGRRADLTRAVVGARYPTREVWSGGEGALARMLSVALYGDWVSYYLALLRGVDPWTVGTLERFKVLMAQEASAGRTVS